MRRPASSDGGTRVEEVPGWWAAARSEQGLVRTRNEDAWRVLFDAKAPSGRVHVFGVFDGVGGMPSGGAAAQAAAKHLDRAVQASGAHGSLLSFLNERVLPTGGATTAVVAVFPASGAAGLVVSVGDSAAYRLDGAGRLDSVAVRDSAGWNRLLDFLGNPGLSGHAVPVSLRPGERLLLCTDGVDAVVGPDPLERLLAMEGRRLAEGFDALFGLVREKGAPDNATAVLVQRTA